MGSPQEQTAGRFPLDMLPLVVVRAVCKYLSARDLSACCATSRRMRDVYGSDFLWAGRSDRELARYLRETPCRVEPPFASPEVAGSTLSPVGPRRLDYMRQTRLWNNWRTGRFVEENLMRYTGRYESPFTNVFLNDDWVVLQFHDRIEILDVRTYPHQKVCADIKLLPFLAYDLHVTTALETVLLVVHSMILAYRVDLLKKQPNMLYALFLDDTEKLKNLAGLEDLERALHDRLLNRTHVYMHQVISGSILVGVLHGESVLHIWDILSGVKLKTQECPLANVSLQVMKCSNKLLLLFKDQHNATTCLVYDLGTLRYSPFRVSLEGFGCIYVVKDFVAVCTSDLTSTLDVYNFETSESVLRKVEIKPFCNSFGDKFVFIHDDKLNVFCPLTRTTECLDLDKVRWFYVVNERFVMVRGTNLLVRIFELKGTFKESCWIFCRHVLDLSVNRTSTRMVDGLAYLIHFW